MKRRNAIFAALAAATLSTALPIAPALAASNGSASTQQVVPDEIEVWSNNGSSYTHVDSLSNIVASVRVKIDTNGWVNSWKTWIRVGAEEDPIALWANFSNHAFFQPYGQGDKPQDVDRLVEIVIPDTAYESMAVGYCNILAANLRAEGLLNEDIFDQDHKVQVGVRAAIQWDAVSAFGSFDSSVSDDDLSWASLKKIDLVCKKRGRSEAPLNDTVTAVPPKVVASSLTLLERSGLSGVCKILLSGVIETTHPDVEVTFRYKDKDGHQSEVISITTDHAKSALFSHEYDIPIDPDRRERGKVRIVGVSHNFKSAFAAYNMDCTEPATNSFEALLPPKLEMQVVPTKRGMVGRQYCVTEVKIVGKITGSAEMSGYAGFVGDNNYISPPQEYEVQKGDVVLLGADRELDWSQAALTFAGQPRSLTIQIGFNATGPSNTIVASLPKKDYTFKCMIPSTDVQAGQGGYSATTRPEPAPAATRTLRLAPRAAGEAPGQPAVPPTAPLRLRQQVPESVDPATPLRQLQRQRLDK